MAIEAHAALRVDHAFEHAAAHHLAADRRGRRQVVDRFAGQTRRQQLAEADRRPRRRKREAPAGGVGQVRHAFLRQHQREAPADHAQVVPDHRRAEAVHQDAEEDDAGAEQQARGDRRASAPDGSGGGRGFGVGGRAAGTSVELCGGLAVDVARVEADAANPEPRAPNRPHSASRQRYTTTSAAAYDIGPERGAPEEPVEATDQRQRQQHVGEVAIHQRFEAVQQPLAQLAARASAAARSRAGGWRTSVSMVAAVAQAKPPTRSATSQRQTGRPARRGRGRRRGR